MTRDGGGASDASENGSPIILKASQLLRGTENAIYLLAAVVLALTSFFIFGFSVYDFVTHLFHGSVVDAIITLLEHLLLGLMTVELLYTVTTAIETHSLQPVPFLVVGLVAAIRRLLTISVEAAHLLKESPDLFTLALYEVGVLGVVILILVVSIILMKRQEAAIDARIEA